MTRPHDRINSAGKIASENIYGSCRNKQQYQKWQHRICQVGVITDGITRIRRERIFESCVTAAQCFLRLYFITCVRITVGAQIVRPPRSGGGKTVHLISMPSEIAYSVVYGIKHTIVVAYPVWIVGIWKIYRLVFYMIYGILLKLQIIMIHLVTVCKIFGISGYSRVLNNRRL